MIEPLERYKRVCSQLDGLCRRLDDTFRLFIQTSTAVVGGFIWLKMQPNAQAVEYLFPIARWIIPMVAIATIIQIGCDHFSWWGYRQSEAGLLNRHDLEPKHPKSGKLEIFRIIITAVAGGAAYCGLH